MFDTVREGIDRRRFLARAGAGLAGALIIGFDPAANRWVSAEEAQGPSFSQVPKLDGTLNYDDATTADSTDQGNIVYRRPHAVLRPGSAHDIAAMVRYCRRHGIKVAPRGMGHTVFGQSLASGLVIETRNLRRIHSIDPRSADVDAGVLWQELLEAAYEHGRLTPPVLTGYVGLTVGGTLSVGGVDGNTGLYKNGLQIDHVQELEVVTGTGDIVTCSMNSDRDLFEAMLGGLGQCGIITRARLDLVPTTSMIRVYRIHYFDNARFFRDFRTLLNRGEIDGVYNLWLPNGTPPVYELTAFSYYEPEHPPDDRHLLRDLGIEATAPAILDLPYLEATQFIDDVLIKPMKMTLDWDRLIKPCFNVWLPDDTVEEFIGDVVPRLTPQDIGEGGFVLLVPQRRSMMNRPFCRVPQPEKSDWVYLFDLLSASPLPGPNPTYATTMLKRNQRLQEKARAAGATRYPISAVEFTADDWRRQYGDTWSRFAALKSRFDPDRILTPGPGIF